MLTQELKEELLRFDTVSEREFHQLEAETFEVEDFDINEPGDIYWSNNCVCTTSCSATSCSVCI